MNPVTDSTHLRVDGPTGRSGAVSPPLVMVHGVGLDLHMWDLVVDALAVERRVVRYDLLDTDIPWIHRVSDRSKTSWPNASR